MNQQNNALKVFGIIVLIAVVAVAIYFMAHKNAVDQSGRVIDTKTGADVMNESHPAGYIACGPTSLMSPVQCLRSCYGENGGSFFQRGCMSGGSCDFNSTGCWAVTNGGTTGTGTTGSQ